MSTGTASAQQPAAALRFRRNADRLSAGQLRTLRLAFARAQALADDRGYDYFASIHGLPLPIGCDNAHNTPYFLPWHRAYLYFFERALRDRVPDAMLTWWDWRTGPRRPPALPSPFTPARVDGQPNPLASAPVNALARRQARALAVDWGIPANVVRATRTFREPGALSTLPTADEVEQVLGLRSFLDFSSQLEQLHGRVHVWTGGHMRHVPTAGFDPVFWAHHTMIDRLWRVWQLRHPGARPPEHILDEALPPFRMTVRQTLAVASLGYDYAVTSTSAARTP